MSVVIRERPWEQVASDMVEGVVVVNRLEGEQAVRARTVLLEALGRPAEGSPAAPAQHPEAA